MAIKFIEDVIYYTSDIATLVYTAYRNKYASYNSCLSCVSNKATKLEKEGKIKNVKGIKQNRSYYGKDAEIIVASMVGETTDETPLESLVPQVCGWITGGKRPTNADVRISKNTSNGRERLCISFNKKAHDAIVGNSDTVSASIDGDLLSIVPYGVEGAAKWTVTKTGSKWKFCISARNRESIFDFVGDYDFKDISFSRLTAPDGNFVTGFTLNRTNKVTR